MCIVSMNGYHMHHLPLMMVLLLSCFIQEIPLVNISAFIGNSSQGNIMHHTLQQCVLVRPCKLNQLSLSLIQAQLTDYSPDINLKCFTSSQ